MSTEPVVNHQKRKYVLDVFFILDFIESLILHLQLKVRKGFLVHKFI